MTIAVCYWNFDDLLQIFSPMIWAAFSYYCIILNVFIVNWIWLFPRLAQNLSLSGLISLGLVHELSASPFLPMAIELDLCF